MTRLQSIFLSAVLILSMTSSTPVQAEPIGLIERYALAVDRTSVLRELIPGSNEYYFLHCLHYQVTGQVEKAEAILAEWEGRLPSLGNSASFVSMKDRQRLITFDRSPDRTVDHLKNRLNIRWDHPAPRRAGERQWPDRLDQNLLQPERMINDAISNNSELTPGAYAELTDRLLDGKPTPRVDAEWLATRMRGRWTPRLGELAILELRQREPRNRGFGDRPIHEFLTLSELETLFAQFAELQSNDRLIQQILRRLRPNDDTDMSQQSDVRLAYLQKLEAFTRTLPEAQNSLKVSATYRLLEAHWQQGEYPRELFDRYLQLPRRSGLVWDRKLATSRYAANLNQDYMGAALLPPVRNEEPLVRAYLEHFLREADSTAAFAKTIEANYLRRVFAETKLLYGVGDSQKWYDMLGPTQRQALTDRVELRLANENERVSDHQAPAELLLDLKHVDELLVRVYRINTEAYYRNHTKPINTDIDLDGLVATSEQRFEYSLPAVRRHRQAIELPAVNGRGVWIVDCLGGGLRARAILRRGDLRMTERPTPDGQEFVILDENRQPVQQARMIVGGQELLADDDGIITLPPVDRSVTRTAILIDGDLAVPLQFAHAAESYRLQANLAVNRQQLRAGKMADLVIRPRLLMGSKPIDLAALEQITLTITATDLDGVETSKRFEGLQLTQLEETVVQFRVPPRASRIAANLSARIEKLADRRELSISDSAAWDINGINRTSRTNDIHLTRSGNNWVGVVRGLTGEALPGTTVQVELFTTYSNRTITATLESDDGGYIHLGPLPNVRTVRLSLPSGGSIARSLRTSSAVWPPKLHGTTDEPLHLPLIGGEQVGKRDLRLVSLRENAFYADLSDSALSYASGMLTIAPLAPGDYMLSHLHDGEVDVLPIAITDGPQISEIATGEIRHLEMSWTEPSTIASAAADASGLKIQLNGALDSARVLVFGSRYLPDYDSIAFPTPIPASSGIDIAENGYVSDLRLGEEYLYVLRRQYAKKYPGVMLPQPSLLIAPWVTDETSNQAQNAAAGDAIPEAAAADGEMLDRAARKRRGGGEGASSESQNLDFMPEGGVLLANLQPNEDGIVSLDADAIGGSNIFRIVVLDPFHTCEQIIARELPAAAPRDLRLANSLDADKAYAFERGVMIAGPDSPLDMQSIGSAQIQIYTEIAELLQLYRTISGDNRLTEFVQLGRWHTLNDAMKQDLYGRLACHEVNIFLKSKDPEFFNRVVRPYLANKKEKQLVDCWLLDRDLTPWTDMWRLSNLNHFEQALLAREVPEIREAILRSLREQLALHEITPDQTRRLVEFGLAGKGLSAGQASALRLGELAEESRVLQEREALGVVQLQSNARGVDAWSALEADDKAFADGALPAPPGGGMGGFGGGGGTGGALFGNASGAPPSEAAGGRGAMRRMARGRSAGRQAALFFQQLDSTKQWAENHWDHIRIRDENSNLIPLSEFWLDWAAQESSPTFMSEHLLHVSSNRHAALVALAMLDLPLKSEGVELPSEPDALFAPNQNVVVITKRLQPLEPMSEVASLLVGQRFEAVNAPANDDDEEVRIAPEEFLTGIAYRGQIVLTNPTPKPRTVDALWQIPEGSLPLAGTQATDSKTVKIQPFEVQRIEYQFYFPVAGEFLHYPVCVSSEGDVVARADERLFNVVSSPTKIDEASWEQIAQSGSADQIGEFLSQANLRKLNLSLVAHRMRDRAIYDVVMNVLDNSRVWNADLWGYAVHHRDVPRMQSYLEQQNDFVASVGPAFQCELLQVEPIARKFHEHLEYAPLVRGRIHPLRDEPEILNDRFLAQYRNLMKVIAHQREPNADQQMAICYYMLLQNRIEEALDRFNQIDRENMEMQIQYEYLSAYLALHRGDYKTAGEIALANVDYPVPRWQQRFAEIESQLGQRRDLQSGTELVGNEATNDGPVRTDAADLAVMDRERNQDAQAALSPDVRLQIEGDSVIIDHRNTEEITLNFYGVDLELLFSKTPFVRQGLEKLAMVQPGLTESITVGGGDATTRYRLSDDLARQTLLVEVVSGSARDTALYYGGRLKTYVSESFGQLQVTDRSGGQPVSTAYVKVYSKLQDGNVQFYKDGYTDLRGRFDYATLSTGNLSDVKSFAILVLDPERGATLHEIAPPTR